MDFGSTGKASDSSSFTNWFEEQRKKKKQPSPAQQTQANSQGWLSGLWGGSASDAQYQDIEQGVESEGFLASTYRKASSVIAPEPEPPGWLPKLSRTERLKGFVVCIILSLLFFALAFFVGLPMVVFAPAKFAFSFTLGSICFMVSFAVLEGPWQHLQRVFSYERLPFTLIYVGSIGATLYCSISIRNYFFTVASSAVQIAALLWYGATYIPGGTTGMRFLSGLVISAIKNMTGPFIRGCCACVKNCFPS